MTDFHHHKLARALILARLEHKGKEVCSSPEKFIFCLRLNSGNTFDFFSETMSVVELEQITVKPGKGDILYIASHMYCPRAD